MGEVWPFVREFFAQYPSFIKMLVVTIFILFVGLFVGNLMTYTAMAIGHLFNKHRILASVLSYFGIYFIVQVLNTSIMGIVIATGYGSEILEMESELVYMSVNLLNEFADAMTTILLVSAIISIVMGCVYFFVTRYILRRRLNLE